MNILRAWLYARKLRAMTEAQLAVEAASVDSERVRIRASYGRGSGKLLQDVHEKTRAITREWGGRL